MEKKFYKVKKQEIRFLNAILKTNFKESTIKFLMSEEYYGNMRTDSEYIYISTRSSNNNDNNLIEGFMPYPSNDFYDYSYDYYIKKGFTYKGTIDKLLRNEKLKKINEKKLKKELKKKPRNKIFTIII